MKCGFRASMRVSADNPRALLKALCFGGMAREKKVKMVDFVKNGSKEYFSKI